jgi:predicted enzyme related to lactoylglutathione lyase
VGLTLKEFHPEFNWAELSGPGGSILGIGQEDSEAQMKAGVNAVVTIAVSDLDAALKHYREKGATLVGEVIEIPGHVKMQTFTDADGNTMQIVQKLDV